MLGRGTPKAFPIWETDHIQEQSLVKPQPIQSKLRGYHSGQDRTNLHQKPTPISKTGDTAALQPETLEPESKPLPLTFDGFALRLYFSTFPHPLHTPIKPGGTPRRYPASQECLTLRSTWERRNIGLESSEFSPSVGETLQILSTTFLRSFWESCASTRSQFSDPTKLGSRTSTRTLDSRRDHSMASWSLLNRCQGFGGYV